MLVVILLIAAWVNKSEAKKLIADNVLLTDERNEAQSILNNQIYTVRLFDDIAKANEDAKKQVTLDSQRTKAGIKSDIANDGCTNLLIPAGANDRLRAHSDKIRNRSSGTDPQQPTF